MPRVLSFEERLRALTRVALAVIRGPRRPARMKRVVRAKQMVQVKRPKPRRRQATKRRAPPAPAKTSHRSIPKVFPTGSASITEPVTDGESTLGVSGAAPAVVHQKAKRLRPLCTNCLERGHHAKTCDSEPRERIDLIIARAAAMRPLQPVLAPAPDLSTDPPSVNQPAFVHEQGGGLVDFAEFYPDLPDPETPPAPSEPEPEPDPVQDEEDDPTPAIARARDRHADSLRGQGITIAAKPLSCEEHAAARNSDHADYDRPKTRGDCFPGGMNEARPCPFAACRHHAAIDVNFSGGLKMNHADLEIWQMAETCSLDVADRGQISLDAAGKILGCTRERTRQLEVSGLIKIRRHPGALETLEGVITSADSNLARAAEN